MRKITIHNKSGFCFGVVKAIEAAQIGLKNGGQLASLGDIVHNNSEVSRLHQLGMQTISHLDLTNYRDKTVLIRAHGEPPSTYKIAEESGVILIDATCPVVLKLQERIKKAYQKCREVSGTLLIYGAKNHAEVNGLIGQTDGNAIVVESVDDLIGVDFEKPIFLFAQTTKGVESFNKLVIHIKSRISTGQLFEYHDTICRQVANRVPQIKEFAQQNDLIVFVGGEKSSNAQVLYNSCKEVNPNSYFISEAKDIQADWFNPSVLTVGICGATSTPQWLMEEVARKVEIDFV